MQLSEVEVYKLPSVVDLNLQHSLQEGERVTCFLVCLQASAIPCTMWRLSDVRCYFALFASPIA